MKSLSKRDWHSSVCFPPGERNISQYLIIPGIAISVKTAGASAKNHCHLKYLSLASIYYILLSGHYRHCCCVKLRVDISESIIWEGEQSFIEFRKADSKFGLIRRGGRSSFAVSFCWARSYVLASPSACVSVCALRSLKLLNCQSACSSYPKTISVVL